MTGSAVHGSTVKTGWRVVVSVILLMCMAGCVMKPRASDVSVESAPRPAWIDNPGDGVSASATFHVRGKQAQEELAVMRAREEFAKRYGVKISSDHDVQQTTVNDRTSSVSEKSIREEVRDADVKAVVKEKWTDPANGALWIWLVPSP